MFSSIEMRDLSISSTETSASPISVHFLEGQSSILFDTDSNGKGNVTDLLTFISLLVPFSLELRHQGFPNSFFREENVEEEEEVEMLAVGFEIW